MDALLSNRTPPHSLEAEMSLLGGLVLDKAALPEVRQIVEAGDFYLPAHASIFAAIAHCVETDGVSDLVRLVDDLRATNSLESVGGISYLQKLAVDCPGPTGCLAWSRVVRGHAIARRAIQAAQDAIWRVYRIRDPDDVFEEINTTINDLTRIVKDLESGRTQAVEEACDELIANLDSGKREMLTTGCDWFDQMGGGLPISGVVTAFGPPSHGKTTSMLHMMAQLASNHGGGGTIHSVEQGPRRVAGTLLSIYTGLPVHDWMNRGYVPTEYERNQLSAGRETLRQMGLRVEPDSMDATQIYRKAVIAATKGVRRIMVDYIQDLKPTGGMQNNAEGMADSMRNLARVATDLNMLVIVVSQMDKAARTADRAPKLNDSRGSGAIADRTDFGICVYRPFFDQRPEDQFSFDAHAECARKRAITEFAVVKNKYGPLGSATVRFDPSSMRFVGDGNEAERLVHSNPI